MLTDSQDSRIMAAATARMVHYDDCTLRKRISKLRDRWYEENLSNNINNDGIKEDMTHSHSMTDSGIGVSPSNDYHPSEYSLNESVFIPPNNRRVNLHEDVVSSIQNEAETSQHIVDNIASTKTMRRRRREFEDLTLRKRKKKARESLGRSSSAPKASKWGEIFDNMIAALRGLHKDNKLNETLTTESENEQGEISDTDSIDCSTEQTHWEPEIQLTYQRCDRHNGVSPSITYESPAKYTESGEFSPKSNSDFLWDSSADLLCGPQSTLIMAEDEPGEEIHWKEDMLDESFNFENNNQDDVMLRTRNLLKSVSFRRHDLASFTLPLAPIRRTDSNNEVWVLRDQPAVLTRIEPIPQKDSTWKRFRRMISRKRS